MKKLLEICALSVMFFAYQNVPAQSNSDEMNSNGLSLLIQKEKDLKKAALLLHPGNQYSSITYDEAVLEEGEPHKDQASLILVSVLAILGLGLIYLFQLLRRKQPVEHYAAQFDNLSQHHQVDNFQRFRESEEKEQRNSIRKPDQASGILSIAMLNTSQLELRASAPKSNAMNKMQTPKKALVDLNGCIREINYTLLPVALKSGRIKPAILNLLTSISAANKITIKELIIGLNDTDAWPQDLCLSLYRAIQEILNLLIKHSTTTHVQVQIFEQKKFITIYIEDNGKSLINTENKDVLGLKLFKNLEFIKGTVEVNRTENQTNFVLIELPLQLDNKEITCH